MIYQVMLSENQSVLIENVNHVSTDDETVRFCEKGGSLVAAFKMYNIVGFFRMDVPAQKEEPISPEGMLKISKAALKHAVYNTSGTILQKETPQWDFEQIDAITKKQQEEAEKKKQFKSTYKYEDLVAHAEDHLKDRHLTYKEAKESMEEAMTEGLNRGGIFPRGGQIPLYVRNMIKGAIKSSNDEYELQYLETLLKRNMEHNLRGYDVYEESE